MLECEVAFFSSIKTKNNSNKQKAKSKKHKTLNILLFAHTINHAWSTSVNLTPQAPKILYVSKGLVFEPTPSENIYFHSPWPCIPLRYIELWEHFNRSLLVLSLKVYHKILQIRGSLILYLACTAYRKSPTYNTNFFVHHQSWLRSCYVIIRKKRNFTTGWNHHKRSKSVTKIFLWQFLMRYK